MIPLLLVMQLQKVQFLRLLMVKMISLRIIIQVLFSHLLNVELNLIMPVSLLAMVHKEEICISGSSKTPSAPAGVRMAILEFRENSKKEPMEFVASIWMQAIQSFEIW